MTRLRFSQKTQKKKKKKKEITMVLIANIKLVLIYQITDYYKSKH